MIEMRPGRSPWLGQFVTNPTARKFGFPNTLVAETEYWWVLARPQQPTYGALVLVCKEEAKAFSELTSAAFADMKRAVDGIEALLRHTVAYERINYLMLMMVDPHVHFHVIPRYSEARQWDGIAFPDAGWPGPPRLDRAVKLDKRQLQTLVSEIADAFRCRRAAS